MGLNTHDSEQQWFNKMGFWNCKSVAELPKPDGTYQQANVAGVLYVSNGTVWSQIGFGGSLGTFATSAALQSAYPAASNLGKTAQIGSTAPYATYISDGSAWSNISSGPSTGTPRSVSGTTDTAVLADNNGLITTTSSSGITETIPNDSTVAWPALSQINIYQAGIGTPAFAAGSGVTLHTPSGYPSCVQYGIISAIRIAANEWTLL